MSCGSYTTRLGTQARAAAVSLPSLVSEGTDKAPEGCGFEPDLPSLSDPDPTLSILRFGPGGEVQGSRGCDCFHGVQLHPG